MSSQQLLNSIGLVFSMLGVLIIFKFGPPQPTHETGVNIGLEDNNLLPDGLTVARHNQDVKKIKGCYLRMSNIGIALVFIGFGFQLLATWSQ